MPGMRVFAAIAFAACTTILTADEKQPAAKAEQPAAKTTPAGDPLAEWDMLNKRREELVAELGKLNAKFKVSSRAEKEKIRAQANDLIDEWSKKMAPRMRKLAAKVLEKKPGDWIALQLAYQSNQFEVVAAATAKVLAGEKNPPDELLDMAGTANFCIHNFDKAEELLKRAQKAGALSQLGRVCYTKLDEAKAAWQKEEQIRKTEEALPAEKKLPHVLIVTTQGEIEVELFEDHAPNTVANFISIVEKGMYDGTSFHRVIPHFMMQGGELTTKELKDGKLPPSLDYTIKCECYLPNARLHFRGTLAMALSGKDTGGAGFYITHLPTTHLNPDADADGGPRGHTVFGRVVRGMDVVEATERGDKLIAAKVLSKRNHEYKPVVVWKPGKEPKKDDGKKENGQKSDPKKDDANKTGDDKSPAKKTGAEKTPAKTK